MAAPKAPPALSYTPTHSGALLVIALKALSEDGRLRVRLGGISMSPFIRDGELAEVGPRPRQPRRGMVLVCTPDDKAFIIHRVIGLRMKGGGWQVHTKGDSLARADRWWEPSEVLGQIVALHRGSSRVPLDRGWLGRLGWLYSWVSPFSPIFYPVAWRLRSAWRKLLGREPH
ncbi:MAG TPA: S24/S26 family peptidase [Chloroflexia bacterium]|nr:S24/S26 family peptidase [Chloroflexia bacterium]